MGLEIGDISGRDWKSVASIRQHMVPINKKSKTDLALSQNHQNQIRKKSEN